MHKFLITPIIMCSVLFLISCDKQYDDFITIKQQLQEIKTDQLDIKKELEHLGIEQKVIKDKLFYISKVKMNLDSRDINCLTKNVFYESGVESFAGKIAVAQVTFNRMKTGRWGNTICKTVYAKKQFSWTLTKKKHQQPKGKLWIRSQIAVNSFLKGVRINKLENSLHYHADYVNPTWNRAKKEVAKIGTHIFYER